MKTYFHGECVIRKTDKIPYGAKKVSPVNGSYKIADSEVTGNYHLLEAHEGVEVYEKDGVLYAKASSETKAYCVDESRHDTITLEPSIWEIEPAKEYDYLTQEKRNVKD